MTHRPVEGPLSQTIRDQVLPHTFQKLMNPFVFYSATTISASRNSHRIAFHRFVKRRSQILGLS